jgi:hypothetical protein
MNWLSYGEGFASGIGLCAIASAGAGWYISKKIPMIGRVHANMRAAKKQQKQLAKSQKAA